MKLFKFLACIFCIFSGLSLIFIGSTEKWSGWHFGDVSQNVALAEYFGGLILLFIAGAILHSIEEEKNPSS